MGAMGEAAGDGQEFVANTVESNTATGGFDFSDAVARLEEKLAAQVKAGEVADADERTRLFREYIKEFPPIA